MIRSPHFYGYGLLLVVVVATAVAWWRDHAQAAQRIVILDDNIGRLEGEIQKAAQNAAILDGYVDHLVGELQKNGAQIERMSGGGFRRTFGVVPPEYRINGGAQSPTQGGPDYSIGRRVELPGNGPQPTFIPR